MYCINFDITESVQICKHPITFDKASSTGTAMPLLMKQSGMYLTFEAELYFNKLVSDLDIHVYTPKS